jgi:prostaglandin-E synthase
MTGPEVVKATPPCNWASVKDCVYLNITVTDCAKDHKLVIEPNKISFKSLSKSGAKEYELELDLFDEINCEESKINKNDRTIQLKLMRVESGSHWKQLTKTKAQMKGCNIETCWDRYVDSDASENEDDDTQNWQNAMNAMNLQGGMGDEDEPEDYDSDDEDLPDLEDDCCDKPVENRPE